MPTSRVQEFFWPLFIFGLALSGFLLSTTPQTEGLTPDLSVPIPEDLNGSYWLRIEGECVARLTFKESGKLSRTISYVGHWTGGDVFASGSELYGKVQLNMLRQISKSDLEILTTDGETEFTLHGTSVAPVRLSWAYSYMNQMARGELELSGPLWASPGESGRRIVLPGRVEADVEFSRIRALLLAARFESAENSHCEVRSEALLGESEGRAVSE